MRARNLKPGIYKNHDIARLGDTSFRLFTGLWCMADRMGRLKDEPEKIQAEIFPFRFQTCDIDPLLDGLAVGEDPFIIRYEFGGHRYIQIKNFLHHQNPHHQEVKSHIPPCKENFAPRYEQLRTKERCNPSSSLIPSSLIPDSKDSCDLAAPKSPESRSFGPQDVMKLWNRKAHPALARVKLLPRTREAHLKARLQNFPNQEDWEKIIDIINASPFLTGLKTKWRVHFDWVLNPQNITKIMEGNYDELAARK